MAQRPTGQRFLETTRGRIVGLLRCGSQTVEELARAVGLTDNAVRAHLATLERDGMVRAIGVRRGTGAGKPAVLYELAPAADAVLSNAYLPMLNAMLQEVVSRFPGDDTDRFLAAVGRRLAAPRLPAAGASRHERMLAAVAVLNALGGAAELEEGEVPVIRGCGCPLGAAVAARPETCQAVESLLSEIVGAPVRQCCRRGERPSCRFEIDPAA